MKRILFLSMLCLCSLHSSAFADMIPIPPPKPPKQTILTLVALGCVLLGAGIVGYILTKRNKASHSPVHSGQHH